MAERVKGSRRYVSPRREEQAAQTRQVVLAAARRLFERDGYVATSVPAVAAEAQVAVKTVYLAVGSKVELLRAVWDSRLAGDEAHLPVEDRRWFRELSQDDSATGKVGRFVAQSAGVKERTGRLLVMIRDAAATDGDIQELWAGIEDKLHQVARALVEQLAALDAMPPGIEPTSATDVVWTLNHPSTWELLVLRRGWSSRQYADWLTAGLTTVLLRAD